MPSSQCATGNFKRCAWSPFDEHEFASAAYSALERSPLALARRLRLEGITPEFWNQLDLPDATAPPKQQSIYTQDDLLKLFAAIADRAQVSSYENPYSVPRGSPLDYSNGPIIDTQALSTFNGPVSPLSLGERSQGSHASPDDVDVSKSVSSIGSVYSSRRSSLDRLFLLNESRHPSTRALAVDGHQNRDQPSGLYAAPNQAASQPVSPHSTISQMRHASVHQISVLDPQTTTTEEESDFCTEADECPESPSSQCPPALMESADSYTHPRINASQKVSVSARKQSSDESRDSNDTRSSMMSGSTSSGSVVEWSHALESKGVLNVSHQQSLSARNKDVLHPPQAYGGDADHENSRHGPHTPT